MDPIMAIVYNGYKFLLYFCMPSLVHVVWLVR